MSKIAREYQALLDKYERLCDEERHSHDISGSIKSDLWDQLEEVVLELSEWERKHIKQAHYITNEDDDYFH